MSSAISNGLGFASYEASLSWYRKWSGGLSPTPAERGAIAGGAATLVMAVIQPLEVIMRRMQVSAPARWLPPGLACKRILACRRVPAHSVCMHVLLLHMLAAARAPLCASASWQGHMRLHAGVQCTGRCRLKNEGIKRGSACACMLALQYSPGAMHIGSEGMKRGSLLAALQVQGREGFPVKYASVADCGWRIVREEGVASFWRGSLCSFMKARGRWLLLLPSL